MFLNALFPFLSLVLSFLENQKHPPINTEGDEKSAVRFKFYFSSKIKGLFKSLIEL